MQTIEINVEIACPKCGKSDWHYVDALVDSGSVPQTLCSCYRCGQQFKVEACVDLCVTEVTDA